jgi:hypothetical protein
LLHTAAGLGGDGGAEKVVHLGLIYQF